MTVAMIVMVTLLLMRPCRSISLARSISLDRCHNRSHSVDLTVDLTIDLTDRSQYRCHDRRDTDGTPTGDHRDTTGHHRTPSGHHGGTPPAPARQPGGAHFWPGGALAMEGSFLSPAHAASPRPHARHEHETETDFPVGGSPFHFDLTPQPPITVASIVLFFFPLSY